MSKDERLVWMDLEMTGLDADKERIIEIAVLVTEGDLTLVAEGPDLVIHQSDELLGAMDEWNTTHHGDSGLTDKVKASELDDEAAETLIIDFLRKHCVAKRAVLAGNSIHQDRRFIRKYMPRLDAFLHYRQVDVSSVKELGRRWYPKAMAKSPRKNESHRAMDDIRESLAELAYYRAAIFRQPPTEE
ncbi:MAG: oligoribonuclease [Deltaproteobacteria bacterium]|nr:MAG: oligoribonuclease [Deltaproteobacteria bacterium]